MPHPGVVGRGARALIGLVVLADLVPLFVAAPDRFHGIDPTSWTVWLSLALLTAFSGWVVNMLFAKPWGWRTPAVLLAGAVGGGVVGVAVGGSFWGPILGAYVWAWSVAFLGLFGSSLVLAAALGTPGCEMRAFAHLRAKMRGIDPRLATCPGWLDRLDHVRLPRERTRRT